MISSRRHAAPLAIAIATGIVVAGGGCNLVVGAGDYKVSTSGDSGSIVGPEAGMDDGSTTLPDGGTPPGPDGGTPPGPDGGTSPDTGAPPVDSGMPPDGGSTLVCGPSGALLPNGLPTNDPAFQQLVRSCVLAVSCDPLFFDVTISDCITRDYLHTYEASDCLSKITSCDDYYACQGSRIATVAECAAAASADSDIGACNGTISTSCDYSGNGIVSDCAALGGTCTVYNVDSLGDTLAGCVVSSGCSDALSDGSTHCASATQVYTCDETDTSTNLGISRQQCPQGSTCQTENGLAGCLATSTSCTTAGASCSNGDVTRCLAVDSGNQQYTSSCAIAGLQCTQGLGTAACTAPGCSPANCTETCSGNQLTVCVGGAPFPVDCPSLGLPTCSDAFDGNNVDYSFCSYQ